LLGRKESAGKGEYKSFEMEKYIGIHPELANYCIYCISTSVKLYTYNTLQDNHRIP
jgi:hypothetical protein